MKSSKQLTILVILCFWVLIVASASTANAASVAEIKARNKLIVLTHLDPMAFAKETAPGQYDGLDIAIMKTLANTLGVAMEVRPVENFSDLIPALRADKGDIIASSLTITKEREKVISFSDSYFPVVMMVVVRNDSKIAKPEDLAGKKGAMSKGSIQEDRVRALNGQFLFVLGSQEQYQAVADGKADFAVFDSTSVIGEIAKFENLKIAFNFPEPYDFGFAVPQGSDLREVVNAHLKKMEETGALHTMIRRYLGDRAFEMLEMIQHPKQ